MKYIKIISLLFLVTIFQNSKAQTYSQPAEVISAGGGETTGGDYSNFGVLAEAFVDYPVVGGSYETSIGFLYHAEGIPVNIPVVFYDNTIKVFPNPTNRIINIEYCNSSIRKIEICNLFGTKVYESEYRNSINVSKFSNGLYFLRMIDDIGRIIHLEKIVKN